MTEVERVVVAGAGIMGAGIAQVAATAGLQVTLVDIDEAPLAKAVEGIGRRLDRAVEKGRLEADAAAAARERLSTSTDLAAAAEGADHAIETVVEDLEISAACSRASTGRCPRRRSSPPTPRSSRSRCSPPRPPGRTG
jgi:3-hydroxybutyryl-CoA dehydrogenase